MGKAPRRSAGVDPYKPLQTAELEKIEARRKALRLSIVELGERAGMDERQMTRIRGSKRAWPREIRALKMALRSIERDRRGAGDMFPGE